jgi:CRP-like cAMP-binding protein
MTVTSLKRSMTRIIGPTQTSAKANRKQSRRYRSNDCVWNPTALVTPNHLIEGAPLFAELTREERAVVAQAMQLKCYRKDDPLFCQGEPSDAFYLIQQGWVKLSQKEGDMSTAGPGSSVGCTDFFLGRSRQMTASAAGEVIAWVLDTHGLNQAIAAHPQIGLQVGLAFGTGIIQFQDYLARGLSKIPLLQNLSDEEHWIIAQRLSPQRYLPRETIYRSGDPPTGIFFIERGLIWLLSDADNHLELGPGQTFGEQAVISGKPHVHTAQAATEVILWQFSATDFVNLASAFPSIKKALTRQLHASLNEVLVIASLIVENEIAAMQIASGHNSPVVQKLQQVNNMLVWLTESQMLL